MFGRKEIHCTNCGYEGKTVTTTKGHFLIEIALYGLFFWMLFVPGIIYTLWRNTSGKKQVCPACGNENPAELNMWIKSNAKQGQKLA